MANDDHYRGAGTVRTTLGSVIVTVLAFVAPVIGGGGGAAAGQRVEGDEKPPAIQQAGGDAPGPVSAPPAGEAPTAMAQPRAADEPAPDSGSGSQDIPYELTDDDCGVTVTLPDADWRLQDRSQGGAIIHVYSPATPPVPRFTLLRLPSVVMPDGLATRAAQLKPLVQADIPVAKATIAGQQADRIDYTMRGVRTIEYGLTQGDNLLIIQVAAAETAWQNAASRAPLECIFASLRFTGQTTTAPAVTIDPSTPDEVRAARKAVEPDVPQFAIRAHSVHATIDPADHRFACTDHFEVESLAEDLHDIAVYIGGLEIDSIAAGGQPCTWQREDEQTVRITLPTAVKKNDTVMLDYAAHSDDYFFPVSQKLVVEIEMLGQVRPESTFSSHVAYYPIDARNDAAVTLALDVPEGMVAVSGGDSEGVQTHDGRSVYTYKMADRRPRLLPLGFAAAPYKQMSATTPAGLQIVFYYPEEAEARAKQRLDIAVRAGTLFEHLMGPLPWKRVSFCHVRPERKETGVSLPGLILISDGFYGDIANVHLRGDALNDPEVLGALVVVDELCHQWNAYATPLPNELAEGISTFTNLLYIGQAENQGEYVAGMHFCAATYEYGLKLFGDVPLAAPKLYESPCYRTVAFTKPPIVLHMLRERLGDGVFFEGWRQAFTSIHDRDEAYDGFRRAFERASGQDLAKFFDDWFFRAGVPEIEMHWADCSNREQSDDGKAADGLCSPALDRCDNNEHLVDVALRQVQEQDPYEAEVVIEIETEDGQKTRKHVTPKDRETHAHFCLTSPAKAVKLDPDGVAPIEVAESRRDKDTAAAAH